jgi:hypothetical protein
MMKNMVMGYINTLQESIMMDNGSMMLPKKKEYMFMKVEIHMMEIGLMI